MFGKVIPELTIGKPQTRVIFLKFMTLFDLGGSPYPNINARQIVGKLKEGYRMRKPSHLDDKL